MWIDATIAFGGVFMVGVVGFSLHWWLGRQERIERESDASQRAKVASP